VLISAPGAEYRVVEEDPEFIFVYPEVAPNQELSITYSVDKEVEISVLDATHTEVYAESYEGLEEGMICEPGEKRCVNNEIQECSDDGKSWNVIEICKYGCEKNKCKSILPQPRAWAVDISYVLLPSIVVILVIVIIVLVKKRKPKLNLPKPMPQMKPSPSDFP